MKFKDSLTKEWEEAFGSLPDDKLSIVKSIVARGVGNGFPCCHPRLFPWDDARFHFLYHAVSDFLVQIHFFFSLLLWGSMDLW